MAGKEVLVPADGIILGRSQVTFYEGESVFDLLQRETASRGIQMESNFNPTYSSAYIAGVGNLYEFDCGSASGWKYSMNGWFPDYGVSRDALQQGDDVQLVKIERNKKRGRPSGLPLFIMQKQRNTANPLQKISEWLPAGQSSPPVQRRSWR